MNKKRVTKQKEWLEFSRTGCYWECLDLNGRMYLKTRETYKMASFIMCAYLQILFGVIKAMRMKRLGYVSCMGEVISACRKVMRL
jgi:hypothetical protein